MSFARKIMYGLDAFKQWAISTFSPKDHNHDSRYVLKSSSGSTSPSYSYYYPEFASFEKDNEKYENENGTFTSNTNNITVDDSCDVNLLKNGNSIPTSFRINGEMFDSSYYWDMNDPHANRIILGDFVIVCGMTPQLSPGAINQLIRIYIPGVRSFFGVQLTTINYCKRAEGTEKVPQFVSFQDNWLYVYMDGYGFSTVCGVAYTVFGRSR